VTGEFAARTRERLRDEVLAEAETVVLERGWRGLRMVEIADAVGVSRQTLYNEFTSKSVLAQALAMRMVEGFLAPVVAMVEDAADPADFWRRGVRYTLERAAGDPLVKSTLGGDGSESFLPLFTSEGGPVLALTATFSADAVSRRWPDLDPRRVRIATEMTSRLIISHITLPTEPLAAAVDAITELAISYLTAPA
jgi:AcrR family transcriptional regulator